MSVRREPPHGKAEDSAVWTTGFGNGLGVVADRLLSAGIERLDERGHTDDRDDGTDDPPTQ